MKSLFSFRLLLKENHNVIVGDFVDGSVETLLMEAEQV